MIIVGRRFHPNYIDERCVDCDEDIENCICDEEVEDDEEIED